MLRLATTRKNVIQPRLEIGRPNDKYEKEADAVADRVMRMPSSSDRQMKSGTAGPGIQMKCAKCEEEEKLQMKPASEGILQMKPGNGGMMASEGMSTRLNHSKNSGQPLPEKVSNEMGGKIGADFSGVKVHTGGDAVQMSQELGAQAFTHGSDIYFNQGKYDPGSSEGKYLLAHELTHTLQQGATSTIRREEENEAKSTQSKKDVKLHDYFHKNDEPCACLVHVHNDERNSKAVARLLNSKCNYNLIDIKDSKASGRGLNKSLKILNEKGKKENKTDPNEIFSRGIIESCFDPVEKAKLKKKGFAVDEICDLFNDMVKCSNSFSTPVVALHNNTILPDKKDKKAATSESTNIYRWAISKAIKKTVIEDQDNPDRVVWTYNTKDYEKLKTAGGVNTALGDETFAGDTDLSTMFNFLPDMAVKIGDAEIEKFAKRFGLDPDKLKAYFKQAIADQLRYINIETEHNKGKYEQNLAEVNLDFVYDVLSKLGLWCCDDSLTPDKLKEDLKAVEE